MTTYLDDLEKDILITNTEYLPPLQGTEKQLKWAYEIRYHLLNDCIKIFNKIDNALNEKNISEERKKQLETLNENMISLFNNILDKKYASEIIALRNINLHKVIIEYELF